MRFHCCFRATTWAAVALLAFQAFSSTCQAVETESRQPASTVLNIAHKLESGQPVKIVCLGDSVTGVYYHTGGLRAYPEMLGLAVKRAYTSADVTIVNAGISGHTTADALKRLKTDVLDHHPDLVTVMFALNDMVRVPVADFQANLKDIAGQCRAIGAEVMFCTPNAVIASDGRPPEKLVEYCQAMHDAARQIDVPLCDCHAAHVALRNRDPLAWRLMMSDPFHPNMDGHKLNAETLARVITGRDVSLADVPPPQPAIAQTLSRLRSGETIRVLAMSPYDTIVKDALLAVAPEAKVEVFAWPTDGQSLAQLEEAAKTVRGRPLDLVLVAVPLAVTPGEQPPPEGAITSYAWILNWALSFGHQEWDVVGIAPGVSRADLSASEQSADVFARRMIAAQDLSCLVRPDGDPSSAQSLVEAWLREQLAAR
jgi:lysophospholipase L1-like esterase